MGDARGLGRATVATGAGAGARYTASVSLLHTHRHGTVQVGPEQEAVEEGGPETLKRWRIVVSRVVGARPEKSARH